MTEFEICTPDGTTVDPTDDDFEAQATIVQLVAESDPSLCPDIPRDETMSRDEAEQLADAIADEYSWVAEVQVLAIDGIETDVFGFRVVLHKLSLAMLSYAATLAADAGLPVDSVDRIEGEPQATLDAQFVGDTGGGWYDTDIIYTT